MVKELELGGIARVVDQRLDARVIWVVVPLFQLDQGFPCMPHRSAYVVHAPCDFHFVRVLQHLVEQIVVASEVHVALHFIRIQRGDVPICRGVETACCALRALDILV